MKKKEPFAIAQANVINHAGSGFKQVKCKAMRQQEILNWQSDRIKI